MHALLRSTVNKWFEKCRWWLTVFLTASKVNITSIVMLLSRCCFEIVGSKYELFKVITRCYTFYKVSEYPMQWWEIIQYQIYFSHCHESSLLFNSTFIKIKYLHHSKNTVHGWNIGLGNISEESSGCCEKCWKSESFQMGAPDLYSKWARKGGDRLKKCNRSAGTSNPTGYWWY